MKATKVSLIIIIVLITRYFIVILNGEYFCDDEWSQIGKQDT